MEIIRSPCDVREESLRFLTKPLRSPYDRHTIFCPQIIIKIEGSPYGACTTCLRSYDFFFDFLKVQTMASQVHINSLNHGLKFKVHIDSSSWGLKIQTVD